MDLDGSTCSEGLPVFTFDFESPEHMPRTLARAHTCASLFRRAPCVPRSREHEKRPAAGRERNADVQKNTFIHSNIGGGYVMGGEAWHTVFKVASIYVSLAYT